MHAMIFYESSQPALYYGRENDDALQMAFHRFAHRQRIEFTHAYNEESAARSMDIFTGQAFRGDSGYEGPREGIEQFDHTAHILRSRTGFSERRGCRKHSDSWMNWLDRNLAEKSRSFTWPTSPARRRFRGSEYALRIKNNPGPGRRLPLLVTSGYADTLDNPGNIIDIWCSFYGHFDIARANRNAPTAMKCGFTTARVLRAARP